MCGIAGIVGYRATQKQLLEAIRVLRHRGPDDNGYFLSDNGLVGFAHTRLSIIDLATGSQPLYSEDKSVVLVINGEIYDFERIRSDLLSKGYMFSTSSDSEVVINLYLEYGLEDMFNYLRGEFAFLLYDQAKDLVIAARDRFGIKPLYVYESDGKFVFSSEAKGVFATGLLKPEVDPIAVRNMLSYAPTDTIFKSLKSLDPGCYLKVNVRNGKSQLSQYWDLNLPAEPSKHESPSFGNCVETVRSQLETSVSLRLRSDVPVGVYLSGGLDSAAVAATIAKLKPDTKLRAFTVSFSDNEKFDEISIAHKMAAHIGADLHVVRCSTSDLLENLVDCLWYSEIPTYNLNGVGKYLLSRLAKKHVSVVLTGEGSDEIFLGYNYFKDPNEPFDSKHIKLSTVRKHDEKSAFASKIRDELGFIPQNEMIKSMSPVRQRFLNLLFSSQHHSALSKNHPLSFVKSKINIGQTVGRPLVRKIQYYAIRGILAPYLLTVLGDRQEMAHAVEGRTPFLDHHLFEAAKDIPDDMKMHEGIEKYILREAMKDRVIPEVLHTPKWPYVAPLLWMKAKRTPSVDKLMNTYLSRSAISKAGIFNYSVISVIRSLLRLWPSDSAFQHRMNALMLFVLCVQIVHDLYVTRFSEMIDYYDHL